MVRLFAALSVPGDIAKALAALQSGLRGAPWRPAESLHITLRFFGEVDERRAEDIAQELALAAIPPFDLTLAGVGCFGEGDKIRAVWAGLVESEPLRRLAGRCEAAARRVGCAAETRNFSPHVTLAYLKRSDPDETARWIAGHNLFRAGPFKASRFGLYSSWPGETGSRYELERFYPLL